MKFSILFLVNCLLISGALTAQDTIIGEWEGFLTQDAGGFAERYEFSLKLQREKGIVRGTTFVRIGEIEATMKVVGKMKDDVFFFREFEILEATQLEDLYWCTKQGGLRLYRKGFDWVLEGRWEGASQYGPCIPGKIVLKKVIPKA